MQEDGLYQQQQHHYFETAQKCNYWYLHFAVGILLLMQLLSLMISMSLHPI
jgi:hypothetical protein